MNWLLNRGCLIKRPQIFENFEICSGKIDRTVCHATRTYDGHAIQLSGATSNGNECKMNDKNRRSSLCVQCVVCMCQKFMKHASDRIASVTSYDYNYVKLIFLIESYGIIIMFFVVADNCMYFHFICVAWHRYQRFKCTHWPAQSSNASYKILWSGNVYQNTYNIQRTISLLGTNGGEIQWKYYKSDHRKRKQIDFLICWFFFRISIRVLSLHFFLVLLSVCWFRRNCCTLLTLNPNIRTHFDRLK